MTLEDVLAANQAFYDAHEARDLEAMGELWERSTRVVCVHPGWPILRSWETVVDSWRRIFSGPGRTQFILTNVEVAIEGRTAWVTLDENLVDTGAMGAAGAVAATNIFTDTGAGWKLVAHHGSPIAPR